MKHLTTRNIVKIGVVVRDIEEAARTYADLFGLEMPQIKVPDFDPGDTETADNWFRGEYRKTACKTAVIPLEPVYIELIEPLPHPSPWTEFQDRHGQGVHYLAFYVDGFEEHVALLKQKGFPLVQKTEKGHERYAYFETESRLGVTVELKEKGSK
jgi:catechol 2,3-dioxygenase-like lactoylglutathione lyase family enzyme